MELFAMDLGNKQVKLKSSKQTRVLPSHFVEASQYGDRNVLGFAKTKKQVRDFVSSKDSEFTYVWGTELDEDVVSIVTDTIGFGAGRYSGREFKLLADFALAELALDFEEAKNGILEVNVVTGVPTSDYNQEDALQELQKALKGDHNIKVNGDDLNIRVKKLTILPQPLGTILSVVMDEEGNLIESPILTANVGVVDVGGGTVLIDALRKMNMADNNRVQLSRGAFTLYESVVRDLIAMGHNINEYEVESVIRAGNDREKYFWSPDGIQTIDISKIVMKHRLNFTRNIASAVKTAYKGFGRMNTILVTGGAANLLTKIEFDAEIGIQNYVENSELANVTGFYKYGMRKE